MKTLTTLPFPVCLGGFLVYMVTTTKTWRQFWEDTARISFWVGLLIVLLSVMGTSVL